MSPKTQVIICGSSLYMASLAAGLCASADLDVTHITAGPPQVTACLRTAAADVIAFDLVELPVDLPVALLCAHPNLLLLGMDPTSEELLVLSGHHARALNVAELVGIITGRAASENPPSSTT